MAAAGTHQVSRADDGAEKRHFQRHRTQIDAVCATLRGAPQHHCVIRDLCPGGMLLQYRQDTSRHLLPQVGEQVDIRCAVPGDAHQNILRFRARVVRTDGESAGVMLINPDLNTLQLLIDFAISRQQAREPTGNSTDTTTAGAPDAATRRQLLDGCRAMAREIIHPLMESFISQAGGQLFDSADHARNGIEQNSYFDALGILNASHDILQESFGTACLERFDGIPGAAAANPDADKTQTKLSLVEEDVLDDWLAVSDIANFVESRQQSEIGALEQRLSLLYGVVIERENNPFGPYAFALAFQRALKTLELNRFASQTCYGSFKGPLLEQLGDLLARMNAFLVENGVLPEIRIGVGIARKRVEPAAGRRGRADKPAAPAQESPRMKGPRGEAGRANEDDRDLYGIVRDIFSLRRQYGHHDGVMDSFDLEMNSVANDTAPTAAASGNKVYSAEEVLSALSQLQARRGETPAAGAPVPAYHSKILSLINERGAFGDGDKRIGGRESGIMYVAGNVFESMFKDMLLENGVRAWLQRLEIPLLKQAIHDDSIFVDKSHVARQVVNKISQLELYGDGQTGGNAIQNQVNGLLNRIAEEIDVDPDVFSKVLKKLNMLVQIQDSAYSDNVNDVIRACENEQIRPDSQETETRDEPTGPEDGKLLEWRKRVLRLKVGSWVLFAAEGSDPQRLRLAWVSRNRDRYVFVNLRGLLEKTLEVGQLARQLHEGAAVILDSADEPAMDRAQYSMLQNLHHQLLFETTHDQLTGLYNRREFERLLQEQIENARLGTAVHALLYIDIDQFSVINTTCGYDAGDKLLLEIGELLKGGMTGVEATAGRIGADEFCLLLENCSTSEASRIAEEQIDRIRNYRFQWSDKKFSISFGIGLAQIDGTCSSATQILQATESSCRAAKQQGVNRIQIHRPDDTLLHNEQRSMKWVARIDKALEEDDLDLRFQSIVPISEDGDQPPHHVEVLLGVTDEDGNPISPQELILAAEHYHRMPAIDRWVIRTAFDWMAQNRDKLDALGGLAINLSGRSLSDESFKDFILTEMQRSGAPMDRVCFEVTETAGIDNLSDAAEFILEMKKSGCTFALDDFGSGLSSYSYLKRLPVDFLKIDGAFVKEMDRNPSDYAVVKSISEIGHFMGKKIIAEYVENETILNLLREIGVDYAQGYVIDKPRRLLDFTGQTGAP
ncbi:MAG: DUF1631 family protein [Gammaproteobacteria bacterium]|nr:DUF1631 family protein [Gammaproteobacteria bacterium]